MARLGPDLALEEDSRELRTVVTRLADTHLAPDTDTLQVRLTQYPPAYVMNIPPAGGGW